MKKALHILLALLMLASAAGVATAQVPQQKCKTCGKPYSECPYKFEHPVSSKKCPTCGKVIDKCQYKGKHPAKCKTCGKTIDKCPYKGKHPAKCSTCGKTVDKCQYGGKHPKCSTCGKTVDQCSYKGNHPEEMCPLENPTKEQIIEWSKKYENFCRRAIGEDGHNREDGYDIAGDMMRYHPCLVYLILNSTSLSSKDEKQELFNLYPLMNEDQIYKLYDILYKEKHKLDRIKNKY